MTYTDIQLYENYTRTTTDMWMISIEEFVTMRTAALNVANPQSNATIIQKWN